jgi:AcrR family transcriptional regulator
MSKVVSIDALMASALELFAERGFEGASLRDIATKAGVPLSTIHMYFGSKSELYLAVYLGAWRGLHDERREQLMKALEAPDGEVSLHAVLHALIEPVVKRSRSVSPEPRLGPKMLSSWPAPNGLDQDMLRSIKWDTFLPEWIDALMRACPTLTREEAVWAFSFSVGSLYSWQLIDNRYSRLLHLQDTLQGDELTRLLVDFTAGGVEAMVASIARAKQA